MEKAKARGMGVAFALGRAYAKRNAAKLAQDADKWVTTKPEKGKGRHVLIDGETGEIKGGLGGKFNGVSISKVRTVAKQRRTAEKAAKAAPANKGAVAAKKAGIDLSHPEKIDKTNILQNRNRSTAGSIMQMHSIAQKPDYMRLGVTHDFGSGAPVVAYGDIDPSALGRVNTAVMPDGKRYKVQYAVVDAGSVLTSNNIDGQKNADYYSDDAGKMRAIAGNGRMTAMQEAYKKGTAEEYKRELMEDDLHGVDPSVIEKMKAPVLVRIMQASDVTPDIGDKSNIQTGLRMTAVEQANNDKNRVNLNAIKTDADGYVTLDSLKAFISQMPTSEQGDLLDRDGNPTRQAADRMDAAIFAKAYGNDELTRLMAQAMDSESRIIMNGLRMAAPRMQRLSEAGEGYDVRDIVARAAERAINARRSGRKLSDEASQIGLIDNRDEDDAASAVLRLFSENSRSSTAIAQKLGVMADRLCTEAHKESADLFGEVKKDDRLKVMRNALGQNDNQASLFGYDSKPKRVLGQDAALACRKLWNKRGRDVLTAIFEGKDCGTFFRDLRASMIK